jgi:hypothetical protein
MLRTDGCRVVCLSSSGHRFSTVLLDDLDFFAKSGYEPWKGYGQAKTANIWMASEIERRYGSASLHATSVMPGGIMTGLQKYLPEEVTAQWKDNQAFAKAMKSPAQGAATTVWAAVGHQWEKQGGKYLNNCAVAAPMAGAGKALDGGYALHAYDQAGAAALWDKSCELVGVQT